MSIGLLAVLSLSAAAQESKKEWRISSPSGHATVYDTQQAAVEAIKNLPAPPPYPPEWQGGWQYADKIKEPTLISENGEISITYWMGKEQPSDPDWKYVGNAIYASEAEMVAGYTAQFQEISSPSCSAMTLEPQGDWADLVPEFAGRHQIKHFVVTVQFGDNTPEYPCEPYSQDLHPARFRRMDCPNPYTSWSDEHNACVNEEFVAVVAGEAEICTADDTAAPLDNSGMQGNPCDVKTGDKYETEPDFDLGWLDLVRYYHSNIATSSGGFGPGWSDTHRMRLAIHPPAIGLIDSSGYTVPFLKVGSEYRATNGSGQRILPSGSQWKLHRRDAVYIFDDKGHLVSRQLEDGNLLSYAYDAYGRLDTIASAQGRSIQFQYADTSGDALITGVSSAGTVLAAYTYDDGRLETVTYPDGGMRTYHYEDARFPRHLTGITAEDGQRYSTFAYDSKGRAISSQHAGGVDGVALAYSSAGTAVTDALGALTTYTMTNAGGGSPKVASVTTSAGTETYAYHPVTTDFRRRLELVTDRRGIQTKHEYATATDPVTSAPVDIHRVKQAFGLPQERIGETHTDQASNRLLLTRQGGSEIRYIRNARLQPSSVVAKDLATSQSRTIALAYCEAADVAAPGSTCPVEGMLKSVDGARTDVSDVTTYTYRPGDDASCASSPATCPYRKGDVWKVTNALGHVTEVLAYDGMGRTLSVKDANGVVTDYEYGPRGWLTATKLRGTNDNTENDDRIARIEYWPTGLIKKAIAPDGAYTAFAYDAAQRLTDVTDTAGNTIHYTLDAAGNRLQEDTKDAAAVVKRTLSRIYDPLGRLQTQADASSNPTDFTYDANDNLKTVTDALGRLASQDLDPLNRVERTVQDAVLGGINAETAYEYDALDRPTKVTDPKGLETTYTYNALGDLLQLVSPDTGTTVYTYDSAGNRATQTDARGVTATYTYDALNRMTAVAYSDSTPGVGYAYDTAVPNACSSVGILTSFAKGRLVRMTDVSGTTDYCYTRYGDLGGKRQLGAQSLSVTYGYSTQGQLVNIGYPRGMSVQYFHDGNGQVTEVRVAPPGGPPEILATSITYAPFGPVTGWTWGNGRTLQRPVDQDYRTTSVRDGAPGGISLGYQYDDVGNVASIWDGLLAAKQAGYAYDPLSRLTQTQDGPTGTPLETYAYDATGNRTAMTDSAGAQAYVYPSGSHRLSSVAGSARSYDAVGNTTAIAAKDRHYVYDGAGRLTQAHKTSTSTLERTYRYNGKGERVQQFPGDPATTSIHTVYDEQGRWLADYDAPLGIATARQQAVWLGDLPIGLIVGSGSARQLDYIEADHLGTPRVVIDPDRDVAVWTWDAKGEAFGVDVPNQDPDGDSTDFVFDMRFPGQRYDAASGLNYNYFRDYDTGTGRYAQPDPIGQAAGPSLFAYVAGSPVSFTDPLGLIKLPNDPSGLPPNWNPDSSHRDPNGERWTNGTDVLDFHKGRPGKPGWRGKDHWHHDEGDKHYSPGEECPTSDDAPPDVQEFMERISAITGLTGTALVIYLIISEGSRLFPPRNLVPVP